MADYISREAAVEKITFLCELREIVCNPDDEFLRGLKNALNAVKSNEIIPSADVQPVKHGYWIKQPEKFQVYEDVINSNYLYSCSCCNASDLHSERANNDGEVKFCWRCGARMDGEQNG